MENQHFDLNFEQTKITAFTLIKKNRNTKKKKILRKKNLIKNKKKIDFEFSFQIDSMKKRDFEGEENDEIFNKKLKRDELSDAAEIIRKFLSFSSIGQSMIIGGINEALGGLETQKLNFIPPNDVEYIKKMTNLLKEAREIIKKQK